MSLEVSIPTSTFKLIYGPVEDKNDEQIVSLLFEGIEEAFTNALGIAIAEGHQCKLRYLDITEHPFKDLGGWRELAQVPAENTAEITTGTECISLSLPLSEDYIQILKTCAAAFGISQKAYTDAINALLVLSYSINKLSAEFDQEKMKPVIRGLETDIESLLKQVSFPGMGGVVDSNDSSGSIEVWGHSQNRPNSIPYFVIFE